MTDIRQDAPGADRPPPEIAEAWGPLWSLVTAQRPDWDPYDVKGAMRAADERGVPYETVARILWRLAWDLSAATRFVLAELTDVNRARAAPGGSLDPGVKAALVERMAEASQALRVAGRKTGGQPALTTDRDRKTSPAEGS